MFSTRLIAALSVAAIATVACHRQQMASSEDHSAHMAGSPSASPSGGGAVGLPASNGASAARLAASTRRGEWIKVAFEPGSRDTISAWVSYPASSGKAPVVVVVHDINGLSTWARGVADQAAAEGFIGVAPDFTSRLRGAPSTAELASDSARKLMGSVNSGERNRIITAVANRVMGLPSAERRYGIIGYCWGGGTVFMHAVNGGTQGFAGGVAYYGLPYMKEGTTPNGDSLAKIKAPVMLFNGSKDARIGAAMPSIDSAMKTLGKSYESKNYDGAVHGFMRSQDDPKATRDPAEEAANLAATKDAWPRTVAFLKKNLGAR